MGFSAYPLSVSDSFACLLQQMLVRRRRFDASNGSVADDQLGATPVDAVGMLMQTASITAAAIVKDAIGFVRFVKREID